ncbi:histidine kinase [Nonomuraea sp. NPDC050404]|uniref:sensor histidine kinase n=1 Tax=Nonomuraea sp. NPDC050404 TaxID=3155783 RepID=UPI00340CF25B
MATRPETAKKILLHWMDAAMAFGFVMFLLLGIAAGMQGAISIPRMSAVLVLLVGFFVLAPMLMREAFDHRPRPTPKLVVAGVLSAALLVILPVDTAMDSIWLGTATLWISLAALYLRFRATVLLVVAVVAVQTCYGAFVTGRPWQPILVNEAINVALLAPAMLLWRWLWWVIRDAHRSREARAQLAVAEERLRFARDLHDLLGHSLSVITLKSELAAKLATKDARRSAEEMAAVRRLAGESLFEVQQAVHGYQGLDLDEELAGVRATLEAAGASCLVEARTDDLSPVARTLLAWAVREGGTNIIKHSKATRCTIRIDGGVLEMLNDGVPGRPAEPGNGPRGGSAEPGGGPHGLSAGSGSGLRGLSPESGSGLRGLSERLVAAGGSFSAEATATGEFVLRAAVPA